MGQQSLESLHRRVASLAGKMDDVCDELKRLAADIQYQFSGISNEICAEQLREASRVLEKLKNQKLGKVRIDPPEEEKADG